LLHELIELPGRLGWQVNENLSVEGGSGRPHTDGTHNGARQQRRALRQFFGFDGHGMIPPRGLWDCSWLVRLDVPGLIVPETSNRCYRYLAARAWNSGSTSTLPPL